MEIDLKKAKRNYDLQRYNANRRKVDFKITFEEWLQVWIDSGQYHNRGRHGGQYVMSRYGDQGAYEVNNVYINQVELNAREAGVRGNSGQFQKGHSASDAVLKKVSDAATKRWEKYRQDTPGKYAGWKKEKRECPHCKKIVAGQRWHFDNCRHKHN